MTRHYFKTYNLARRYCANAGLQRSAIKRTTIWMGQWGETRVWYVEI